MDRIDRPTDAVLAQMLRAGEEEDAALPAGSQVGRYVVLERLGSGGMSVVYKAYDPQLDRAIALKLMRTAPAGGGAPADASTRVLREAQALARLSHPNVVAVHDVGMFGDAVFAATEYVAGETLGAWCKGRSPEEILRVFRDAGRGLAAAHAAGLVHRDFKPDNVIVGRDGRVRVIDFGLALGADAREEGPVAPVGRPSLDARITRDGVLVGTPAYMAPEQHVRRGADARSDQFSFCVALYEALHGCLPFEADGLDQLSDAVTHGRVREPPPDTPAPAWSRPVLLRGLAVDPAARWESMDALLAGLERGPRSRRLALAAAVAAIALLSAAGAFSLVRETPDSCRSVSARLGGVWDARVKQSVRQAFARSDRAHADATFARVARVLDGQAAEWVAMQRDVCESRRDGRLDADGAALRQRCLDERRSEMAELAAKLSAAGGRVVDGAVHSAFELAGVEACADVAALALGVSPPADSETDPNACGVPPQGRYFPLEAGRVWVYDVIDKSTRRSRGDPKVVTVDGLMPIGGCRGDKMAFRTRQESREGWAFRWQEALPARSPAGHPPGLVTVRHRDEWFAVDGTVTKDVHFVPGRIRLDETCAHSVLGATYLDAYDQVEVAPGRECEEVRRERRTFEWRVVGVDVPVRLELDYTNPACCPDGTARCGPPPDGPGHTCSAVADGAGRRWSCEFRTLQVDRREVSGRTAASSSFAVDVGKVLDDERGEDREVLTCFARATRPR